MTFGHIGQETHDLDPTEVSEECANALKAEIRRQTGVDYDEFVLSTLVLDARPNGSNSHVKIQITDNDDR